MIDDLNDDATYSLFQRRTGTAMLSTWEVAMLPMQLDILRESDTNSFQCTDSYVRRNSVLVTHGS